MFVFDRPHSHAGPAVAASAVLLLAFACGSGAEQASPAPAPAAQAPAAPAGQAPPAAAAAAPDSASKGPAPVLEAYLQIQEKLAADDAAGAKAAFGALQGALAKLAAPLPASLGAVIEAAAQKGASADAIDAQREAFDALSKPAIELLRQDDNPLAESLQLAHCPMAFDNRGAAWLQRSGTLQNPYFGAEMLTCGAVDATVASAARLPPAK
ncbi:MAG: DUF3347 domain-containing protein [Myxococcales bacterium]|nr:DUF3347 domain-containing protein [Myxococcales bacterium]